MIDNIDIDLDKNSKLFPIWILKKFRKYKLQIPNDLDPCKNIVFELQKYQIFLSEYLISTSQFKDILIYHGLGTGKTISAINIYNSSPDFPLKKVTAA